MTHSCDIVVETYREDYLQASTNRDFWITNCTNIINPDVDPCIDPNCPPGYTSTDPVKGISDGQQFCMNDVGYCNRFVPGDILYLQYHYAVIGAESGSALGWNTGGSWGFDIIIEDKAGNTLMSGIATFATDYGVGWSDNFDKFYEWINIDTSLIDYDEFVIHLQVKNIEGTVFDFFSLPYCAVECWEQNVLLQSNMINLDLDGNTFVDPDNIVGNSIDFLNQVRIPAELIKKAHKIETTLTNGVLIKNKKTPQYLLRTQKLPEYVADKIALILSSANIYISFYNGIDEVIAPFEINNVESVDKNFDDGKQWIIEQLLSAKVDEMNINCNA